MFTETRCGNTVLSSLRLIVWWWDPKGGKPVGMRGREDGNLLVNTNDDMHFPNEEENYASPKRTRFPFFLKSSRSQQRVPEAASFRASGRQ